MKIFCNPYLKFSLCSTFYLCYFAVLKFNVVKNCIFILNKTKIKCKNPVMAAPLVQSPTTRNQIQLEIVS